MARSGKSTKSRSGSQAKSGLAKLRRVGLTKAKPKGRPGGSAYALLRRFKLVLQGKAAVVKAPKETRKKYAGEFEQARGRIVVPTITNRERVRVSKKTKELIRTTQFGERGAKIKAMVVPRLRTLDDLPKGPNIGYIVHIGDRGKSTRLFRNFDFLDDYVGSSAGLIQTIGAIEPFVIQPGQF